MINAKETGRFIAECRRKKGMTQQELGDRLHVTDRAVSKWETGRAYPDIVLLGPLARILGADTSRRESSGGSVPGTGY